MEIEKIATDPRYYRLQGKTPVPIKDTLQWGDWYEKASRNGKRIVKQQVVANGIQVSTVFLSIDHGYSWMPGAIPVLFETMVFGGPLSDYHVRYTNWEAAEKGHEKTKQKMKGIFLLQRLKKVGHEKKFGNVTK